MSHDKLPFLNQPGRGDALTRGNKFGSTFELFASDQHVIPRSQWDQLLAEHDYTLAERYVARIKRQTIGSCASHSATSCLEYLRNKAVGASKCVLLSPLSVFKFVGSRHGGSTLDANMRQISEVGVLPLDTPENRAAYGDHVWPENQWSGSLPSGWEETAARFRFTEWNEIGSFDELFSALLQWKPVYYGRAGHAIYAVRPMKRDGQYVLKYANSWGAWGDAGYGYDTERYVSSSIRSYGCYAPRASLLLPEDALA